VRKGGENQALVRGLLSSCQAVFCDRLQWVVVLGNDLAAEVIVIIAPGSREEIGHDVG
jgi:hypothetical protein